jgi:hypothetical protein
LLAGGWDNFNIAGSFERSTRIGATLYLYLIPSTAIEEADGFAKLDS